MTRWMRTVIGVLGTLILLAFAAVPGAARTGTNAEITVTQPAHGQAVSKLSEGFAVAGRVDFAEPSPTSTDLYLRYEAVDSNSCGRRYLSGEDGPDAGNSCQSTGAHNTFIGQSFTRDWPADPDEVSLPLTIDASRNITGEINITSAIRTNPSPGNWVTLDLVVRLDSTTLTQSFDSGPFAGATHKFLVDLDVPGSLDKLDVTNVQVDLVWHRVVHLSPQGTSVIHTYVELEDPATFLSIPTYAASFDRRVDLAVDSPNFSANSITATSDLDAGTFTASHPTASLEPGGHTLYARAVQGRVASSTQSVPFTVTDE